MAKNRKQKWAPGKDIETHDTQRTEHFAARTRDNDFLRLLSRLPDLDPVLRKMGKSITALQELLTDSHLESVWSVRCAATSGAEWFCAPGDDSAAAEVAAEAFAAELQKLDVPRIIEEMMDAVAYGYSPLEVLWTPEEGRWGIADIVGKPPQWFEFNQRNELVLKRGIAGAEELPPNRFLLVQHRPSYANPYGAKVFSKCYWPCVFKKNGMRWWTAYVEKYGGAFMYGKYPMNAGQDYQDKFITALSKMATDAVAIFQEGSEITITTAADKKGGSDVHDTYIQKVNAEISKAVLGQTLTTEIGNTGSYAAAAAHNLVREDLAAADRRRICAAFDRLAKVYTMYNFGDVAAPLFQFVKDEDLQLERAGRDVQLYQVGWRPKKEYFMREYGMQEDDFDIQEAPSGDMFPGFAEGRKAKGDVNPIIPDKKHPANCSCGCRPVKRSLFRRLAMLFASKEEKEIARDSKLMDNFETSILRAAQAETDRAVDVFADALGNVNTYDDAKKALVSAYGKLAPAKCAALLSEIRYAAGQIGAQAGRRKGGCDG